MSKIEQDAKKWFLSMVDKDEIKRAKKILENEENMEKIIEEYKQTEQYKKSKFLNKIKVGAGIGVATVGLAVGAHMLTPDPVEPVPVKPTPTEPIEPVEDEDKEKHIIEEDDEFFKIIENEKNTDERNQIINQKTKEIIVTAYNMQNPDKQITADDLEILILNETVREKKDKLGNITYERIPQNLMIESTETEKPVKIGEIYVFSINGDTVATYDKDGNRLKDDTIKEEEPFFHNTLEMVKESQKLVNNFKYATNEYSTAAAESKYIDQANFLIEEASFNKEVQQEIEEMNK